MTCIPCSQAEVDPSFAMHDAGCWHCACRQLAHAWLLGGNEEVIDSKLRSIFAEKWEEAKEEVVRWGGKLLVQGKRTEAQ